MATASGKKSVESIIEGIEKSSFKPKFMDPINRLAFAVLADGRNPADAQKALNKLTSFFIDWNEIRVSRWVEIADCLKPLAEADTAAIRLRNMLNRLFDLRGEMTTDFMKDMKISEAKKVMLEIDPDFSRQDIALITFQCIPGLTPPLSPEMIDTAKTLGIIPKNGKKDQLAKLISEQSHEMAAKIVHYIQYHVKTETKSSKTTSRTSKKK